jgi:hypothetical protein
MLLDLLVAEKSGFASAMPEESAEFKQYGERMVREAMESLNGAKK